jgi:hypothetical protein
MMQIPNETVKLKKTKSQADARVKKNVWAGGWHWDES